MDPMPSRIPTLVWTLGASGGAGPGPASPSGDRRDRSLPLGHMVSAPIAQCRAAEPAEGVDRRFLA